MLRLAYYTEVNLRNNDGPAINELEFVNSLQSYFDNPVIFLNESNREALSTESGVNFYKKPSRVSNLLEYWTVFKKINKHIRLSNINILVVRVTDFPVVVVLLKLFNPHLKIYVKTASLWWEGRVGAANFKDVLYLRVSDILKKIVYRVSAGIDVAMLETKNELLRLGLVAEKKIISVDNAINTKIFIPNRKRRKETKKIVLGFAGGFPSFRGVSQMLKVGERLLGKYDINIKIIGDDKNLKKLMATSNFPAERIMCLGKIQYSKVAQNIEDMTVCYSFFEDWAVRKTGNASQKVKHYISMGKPVISVNIGHQYLVDNDLGSAVDQNDIDEITQETEKWIKRVQDEGKLLRDRLHAYACEHLSTQKTFQQRLEFWKYLLEK